MKRINPNPALKHAYDTLVKDLPDDQKEGVIAQIACSTRRARRVPGDSSKPKRGGGRCLTARNAPACDS